MLRFVPEKFGIQYDLAVIRLFVHRYRISNRK